MSSTAPPLPEIEDVTLALQERAREGRAWRTGLFTLAMTAAVAWLASVDRELEWAAPVAWGAIFLGLVGLAAFLGSLLEAAGERKRRRTTRSSQKFRDAF